MRLVLVEARIGAVEQLVQSVPWRRLPAAPRGAPAPAPRRSPRSPASSVKGSTGKPWRGKPPRFEPLPPPTECSRGAPSGPPRRAGGGTPGRGGPCRGPAAHRRVAPFFTCAVSIAQHFETRVSILSPFGTGRGMLVERMAVEIEGEGEPVLMIHGLGGTTNTFTPVLAAFARHRTRAPRPARVGALAPGRWSALAGAFVDACGWSCSGRGSSGARRRALDGHDRRDRISPPRSPDKSRASRSSARCWPRPMPARAAIRAAPPRRARAKACSRIADALHAPASRPRRGRGTGGRRLRARVADAPGSRGLRAQLRGARRDAAGRHRRGSTARRCSSPATRTPSPRPRRCA